MTKAENKPNPDEHIRSGQQGILESVLFPRNCCQDPVWPLGRSPKHWRAFLKSNSFHLPNASTTHTFMNKGVLLEKDIGFLGFFLCLRTANFICKKCWVLSKDYFKDFPNDLFHVATDPLQSPSLLYGLLNLRDGTSKTGNTNRISGGIQVMKPCTAEVLQKGPGLLSHSSLQFMQEEGFTHLVNCRLSSCTSISVLLNSFSSFRIAA